MILTRLAALAVILLVGQFVRAAETPVDLGPVIEKTRNGADARRQAALHLPVLPERQRPLAGAL